MLFIDQSERVLLETALDLNLVAILDPGFPIVDSLYFHKDVCHDDDERDKNDHIDLVMPLKVIV